MNQKTLEQLSAATVDPRWILEQGYVTSFDDFPEIVTDLEDSECALQQNGIDLRISEASVAVGHSSFTLNKRADSRNDYHAVQLDQAGMFTFQVGKQYALDFMEQVEIPTNYSAYIFVRSSINRYAGTILTGYWDSGFKGRLGGIFRPSLSTTIEYGCRVAQVVFYRSDSARPYDGQYQNQKTQTEGTD